MYADETDSTEMATMIGISIGLGAFILLIFILGVVTVVVLCQKKSKEMK